MRYKTATMTALALLAVSVPTALGQYDLSWFTIDSGGDMFTTGGTLELSGTIGQPDAGFMAGGTFALSGGFWHTAAPPLSGWIEIAQESAPGAGDFNDNVYGYLMPHDYAGSAADFYAYDVPEAASWNGAALTPIVDRSHLLMANTTDGLTLFIVHDRAIPDDPDGGKAEVSCELFGDVDGAARTVEDDPGELYVGDPGDSLFTARNAWGTCCTDGFALSDLEGSWLMIVQFTDVDSDPGTPTIAGLSEWVAYSDDDSTTHLSFEEDRRVRLRPIIGSPLICRGDLNCDGFIDFGDINPFVLALSNWPAWQAAFPGCPERNTDVNGDGDYGGPLGFGDINPFVALLASGGGNPIPCP